MRVVVVGASGNVGTSVVAALAADPQVEAILGLARRLPELELPRLRWAQADVATDDLEPHFRGAYAVGPKDRFETAHPETRVVRLRPGLIFKAEAASEIRRLFLGPLFPRFLANPRLIPVGPRTPRLRFQAVHSYDVGEAYRLAVLGVAPGAFNLAAEPAIGPPELARPPAARRPRLSRDGARGAADGQQPGPDRARLGTALELARGARRPAARPARGARRPDPAARPGDRRPGPPRRAGDRRRPAPIGRSPGWPGNRQSEGTALVVLDMLNSYEHEESEELAEKALAGRHPELVEPILPAAGDSFVIKARHDAVAAIYDDLAAAAPRMRERNMDAELGVAAELSLG